MLLLFVVAFASTRQLCAQNQLDVINKEKDTSSQTVWRITQPNVKQASTNYPEIKFVPGDSVNVTAGGCVQTGGHGQTWKLYVNPQGPNADRLYHGKIWIPGLNSSLTRIKDFSAFNKTQTIHSPLQGVNPADMYLRLGYEDDGYGDNGYTSHDDGTGNQCKNSVNAFVIISIGHNGNIASSASSFVGIEPAQYRCQAGWAFQNFNTSELSDKSFNDAFSLSWYDYLDPATWITYLAARGMASGGNCAGMSLLADAGEDQFVVGQLDESFWANYKSQTVASPTVTYDINVAHWKQLSTTFLKGYIGTAFQSPSKTAAQIEADLTKANYNYGLLSIAHGTDGHVLVPLRVNHVGSQIRIDVYDSNRPCAQIPDTTTYPQVIINGDSWSYDMGSLGTWSDSSSGVTGYSGLGYVSYLGPDGWSDLGTNLMGLVKIIFGSDVNVEQVTDASGKRLYTADGKSIEKSEQGLGNQLIRVPMLFQSTRPRSKEKPLALNLGLNLTAAQQAQVRQIQSDYAEYANSGQIFLASPQQLKSLTFTVTGATAGKPVRMMVGQSGQFYEMKATPQTGVAHPNMVIQNLSVLSEGVSIQSRDNAALKVAVTHGLLASDKSRIMLQSTGELPVGSALTKFSLATDSTLQLAAPSVTGSVPVTTRNIDRNAAVTAGPARTIGKLQ